MRSEYTSEWKTENSSATTETFQTIQISGTVATPNQNQTRWGCP